MAKRNIVWSKKAEIKLFDILDFYKVRNGNTNYSNKLYQKFIQELYRLDKFPEIGIKTEIENIRGLIVDGFILFYEVEPKAIYIHTLWDCKQNPKDLNIK